MAYGLRIINDASELLIDSDYVNPTFVQKLEFNNTPTSTESGIYSAPSVELHANYLKSVYTTTTATLNSGNYIVLWKLPDNGNIDVYYNFPTSVMDVNRTLTCEVFSGTTGGSLSYTLPTAYIFAVDAGGLSTLSSSAPALRLYNSSSQLTFNSSYTQLVPYNFSTLTTPNVGETTTTSISGPTNGIYLLPKTSLWWMINDPTNPGTYRQIVWDNAYKRYGSTISAKSISTYWTSKSGSTQIYQYYQGTGGNVLVADGDLYEGSNGSTINVNNPTYTLSANYATVNETTSKTITITLTTTNVTNDTVVYYNVTGISAADLTTGSLNGSFTIQNNTATAGFTVATDSITEGTETFLLSLVGITQSISVSILDTSRAPFTWSSPSATSVDEGSSIYLDFNALYNDPTYPVTFSIVAPGTPIPGQSQETIYAYPDLTISYAIPSGANYTRVTVNARADLQTEGAEKWRLAANVDNTTYYSSDITINDTTTSSITTADNWTVGTDNTVTITVIGGLGKTVNLYSIDSTVLDVKAGSASSWYVNSNNFTVSTTYQAKTLNPGTFPNVGLWLKNGDEFVTVKYITTSSVASYSWAAPSTVNEGSSGSLQFNYTNATAGTVFNFNLQPGSTGTSATSPDDGSLDTTTYTVPTTGSGSVSVGYSIVADSLTEGTEYFRIQAVVGTSTYMSGNIGITDTSLTPSYGIIAVNTPWNENTTQSTTIALSNVNGYTYVPTSSSSAVTCQTSIFTVTSNNFTTTLNWNVGAVTADTTVTLYLRRSRSSGIIDAQTDVVVKDVPVPTYSFTSIENVTETQTGNSIATFTYTNVVNKTVTFAIVAPSTGNAATSGTDITLNITSMDINGSSFKEVSYYPTADNLTEGTEYFRITATIDGQVVATSGNISISDTSTYPVAGTLLRTYCAAYGVSPYTLVYEYANGNGGTYTDNIYNSTTCGYVATPTYTLTEGASSVNEGSSITFTVGGTNITNSTYYWSVTNSSDFSTSSGSVTVSGNSGSFSVTPTADVTTEGAETFQARLYTDSGRTNLVATSGTVTINDTSQAPSTVQWRTATANTTWIVPAGVTSIYAICIGGGGGGRSFSSSGGGGGAGGISLNPVFAVTPGETLTITIGAGGGSNTSGGTTSITRSSNGTSISAAGGSTGAGTTGGNAGASIFGTFYGALGAVQSGFNAGGGGGGSRGDGLAGFDGEGGDGGYGVQFDIGAPVNTTYNCAAGGGGGGNVAPGIGGETIDITANLPTGILGGGGTGAVGGTTAKVGGAATATGSGGGGGRLGGAGGAGYRGQVWWYA